MTNLITRLRDVERFAPHDGLPSILDIVAKDCAEAADRIAELERSRDEMKRQLAEERMAIGEAASALNEAGVPFEIHVEGGMCFTGLRPRIAWLAERFLNARNITKVTRQDWLRSIDKDGYRTDDERMAARILLKIA